MWLPLLRTGQPRYCILATFACPLPAAALSFWCSPEAKVLLGVWQVLLSEEEQGKAQERPDKLAIGGEGGFQVGG